MNVKEYSKLISDFRWSTLERVYGCAHSSIIGFISSEWINLSPSNSIIDGAPSSIIGKNREGQRNADVLLCKGSIPYIIVEVETNVNKYEDKIISLISYLENQDHYNGLEAGLLFMSNLCSGNKKYKHNWDDVKKRIYDLEHTIALISVIKKKMEKEESALGKIRRRNDYYPWDIEKIDYWIHTSTHEIDTGTLWDKTQ